MFLLAVDEKIDQMLIIFELEHLTPPYESHNLRRKLKARERRKYVYVSMINSVHDFCCAYKV